MYNLFLYFNMLDIFLVLFEIFSVGLLFACLFVMFKPAFLAAIAGAIVSLFLDASAGTCATIGFCVGIVYQLATNFRNVVPAVISLILGVIACPLVRNGLEFIGFNKELAQCFSILSILGVFFLTIVWVKEKFDAFFS